MFLKQLIIQNGDSVIRTINFKKGLNLIIDETPEDNSRQLTGNNVGKTTVLRLVYYCFGGSGKSIYADTEFGKQPNTKIENFLKDNNILITTILSEDIDDNNAKEIVIRRNFLMRKEKIQDINGEKIINQKEFARKLKELIFKSDIERPSFKEIIAKNIRDEKHRINNIVKVLGPWGGGEKYESLFLFWLGVEVDNLDTKYKLLRDKKEEANLQKRLAKENSLSLIEQTLTFVENKIKDLGEKKKSFNLNKNFNVELEELNEVKLLINKNTTQLGSLEMRKELILESREDLEQEYSDIDIKQIKSLYQSAQSLISNIQVSFEDTVRFHNDMVKEKIEFITKELPEIENHIATLRKQVKVGLKQEEKLTKKLQKAGLEEDLELIITELNKQYERKGKLEEQKRLWKSSNEKLKNIEEELDSINTGINSKDKLIQERLIEFNKYFSEISHKLYGEYYLLSSQKNDKGYELVVTNIEGNPSTGKKKGQIAAFDFAYIQFADTIGKESLRFIMHDQLENIHDNQFNTLVDIANSINCQYIVPILRDKIPPDVDVSQYERLSLSQKDKLFKIP